MGRRQRAGKAQRKGKFRDATAVAEGFGESRGYGVARDARGHKARGQGRSSSLSPSIFSKCLLLKLATEKPKSRAVEPMIRS